MIGEKTSLDIVLQAAREQAASLTRAGNEAKRAKRMEAAEALWEDARILREAIGLVIEREAMR